LLETLRDMSRISGELQAYATTSISIVNNSVAVMNSPVIAELQSELLTALAPYPDARQAVIALFVRLDERHRQPEMKTIEGRALEPAE
jgi:hypothetical protein